jgi:hypothetical protein
LRIAPKQLIAIEHAPPNFRNNLADSAINAMGVLKQTAADKGVDLADLWKAITKAGALQKGAKAIAKAI